MARKANNIFSILDDSGSSEKANIDTLTAIVEEFGTLPNTLYVEDDLSKGWDYAKVAKLAYLLARQSDPEAKEDDIRSKIMNYNIYSIAGYINKSLMLEIPEELQKLILDNIEMSRIDVLRGKLSPKQVNDIVNFVIEKEWLTAKDFDKTIDEPPVVDTEVKN